jgi:hypothetical protein
METSTRIIDYHSRVCMEGGFLKIILTERNHREYYGNV